jgi:hypothetical protein
MKRRAFDRITSVVGLLLGVILLIGGGKVYSELSGAEMGLKAQLAADPKNATLANQLAALDNQVNTVFKGESLRGMLLNAYAFWQLGQIAIIASWVTYLGGLLFIVLALTGFAHSRRMTEGDMI